MTTASFYRIAGGSTQLKGIEPDIVIPSPLEAMEIGEETLPHALPWSQIGPAYYDHANELPLILDELKQRSKARLAQSEKYSTYTNLLGQMAVRQRAPTISLNLEQRLQLAASERALREAIEDKPAHDGDEGKVKRPDFALDESLQVLCDWLSLRQNTRVISATRIGG